MQLETYLLFDSPLFISSSCSLLPLLGPLHFPLLPLPGSSSHSSSSSSCFSSGSSSGTSILFPSIKQKNIQLNNIYENIIQILHTFLSLMQSDAGLFDRC